MPFFKTARTLVRLPRFVAPVLSQASRLSGRPVEWIAPAGAMPRGLDPAALSVRPVDTPYESLVSAAPRALVAGAQPVTREAADALAKAGLQRVVRRGASTAHLAPFAAAGVEVSSTPAVNARAVADFAIGRVPPVASRITVVGAGAVGKSFVEKLLHQRPGTEFTVLTRACVPPPAVGSVFSQPAAASGRITITNEPHHAFEGAQAVLLSAAANPQSRHLVQAAHVDSSSRGAAWIGVSRPDIVSDAALARFGLEGRSAHFDYDPATLASHLHCRLAAAPLSAQRAVTSGYEAMAAAGPDMDVAALTVLASRMVGPLMNEMRCDGLSFRIPDSGTGPNAPPAAVVGCGFQGLMAATLLRARGHEVTVYGRTVDSASHIENIRHFSATEWKPTAADMAAIHTVNPALVPIFAAAAVAMNNAGIRGWSQFLEDNPALSSLVDQRGMVRVVPRGLPLEPMLAAQRAAHDDPAVVRELSSEQLSRLGISNVGGGVHVPGMVMPAIEFLAEWRRMLGCAGVSFKDAHVSPGEINDLKQSGLVVEAMGAQARDIQTGQVPKAVAGFFVDLPSIAGEGDASDAAAIKLHQGQWVVNTRREPGVPHRLIVSGGFTRGDEPDQAKVRDVVLKDIQRHFPRSYQEATAPGALHVKPCFRPGSDDGLDAMHRDGTHVSLHGTVAAGATKAPALSALMLHGGPAHRGISMA